MFYYFYWLFFLEIYCMQAARILRMIIKLKGRKISLWKVPFGASQSLKYPQLLFKRDSDKISLDLFC